MKPEDVKPGLMVRHFKHASEPEGSREGMYTVVCIARDSTTKDLRVIYRTAQRADRELEYWDRSMSEFCDTVHRPNYVGPRFIIL